MDVIQALSVRHSTRAYQKKQVDKETILKVLEAANQSPSWANSQPWEVFVAAGESLESIRQRCLENFRLEIPPSPDISMPKSWTDACKKRSQEMGAAHLQLMGITRDDKAGRTKMSERNLNFFGAPSVIFLCMDKELSQWSLYDLGAFSQSLMLAAQHYGLNTIPAIMMAVYPDVIREELMIPDNLNIVIGIALGYALTDDLQNQFFTTRKPLNEFVRIKGI